MNRAATMLGTSVSSLGLLVAYDYNTCHPMRKMTKYDVGGAFIRMHNILRRNMGLLPAMTLSDLSRFDGSEGRPTYFSADGLVYDVSSSEMFQTSYSLWKGKDATVALAQMSLDRRDINRTDWDSLSEDDLKSLHSWTHYFSEKYLVKGSLTEFHERRT